MKTVQTLSVLALLAAPLLASCAHPLEKVVEANHQERVKAMYANQPINYGAGDGLGHYIAQTADSRLTLSNHP